MGSFVSIPLFPGSEGQSSVTVCKLDQKKRDTAPTLSKRSAVGETISHSWPRLRRPEGWIHTVRSDLSLPA